MSIATLWMPILLAAVLVFFASSLVHMVLKWHNSDYNKLPNEEAVRDVLRAGSPTPAMYIVPYCPDHKLLDTPEYRQKFEQGPIAFVTVRPNGFPKMGGALFLWFLLALFVAAVAAAVACIGLPVGAPFATVFAATAWVAFLAYGAGSVRDSIWMGKAWSATGKELVDAAIYACITAASIAWLWPR
jgi:hypothetical protein